MTTEPIKFYPTPDVNNRLVSSDFDIVKINKLKTHTVIGICEDELFEPQPLIITVEMGIPRPIACESDNINETVDYDSVRKIIISFAQKHRHKLLESFAEDLSRVLINKFSLSVISIELEKPHKYPDVESVGFFMQRKAENINTSTVKKTNIFSLLGKGIIPEK